MDNYIAVLKKYSDFESTSFRKEYWIFVLFNIIFSSITVLINPILSALYSLLIFIPALAVTVRRLHDVGKSGWMMLIVFIPFIGPIWLLVLLLKKGDSYQEFDSNDFSLTEEVKEEETPAEEPVAEEVKQVQENIETTKNINADDFKRK